MRKQSLQKPLLGWYDKNKRKLPWRSQSPDPYKVWISEIMLQQTQVETALPYYERFLKEFPTLETLANAPREKVLTLWSGLGYYARARNLHKTAKYVLRHFGGILPKTKGELRNLPGIGDYTAGAVASIAFGQRVPVVDGNVVRVLCRLFVLGGDPGRKPLKEKLWRFAAKLVSQRRPGDFNQALMELGALVCLPKEPNCPVCPLNKICKAYCFHQVSDYPTPREKLPTRKIHLTAALIEKKGAYLLAKRGRQRHLQSMWEFPQIFPKEMQLKAQLKAAFPMIRHAIMNRRIQLTPHLYQYIGGKPKPNKRYVEYRWIKPSALEKFPTSSINHKVVHHLRAHPKTHCAAQ